MPKSEYLHMRIDPKLKEQIRREADSRHIDTSALVSLVLAEWLERNAKKRAKLSEPSTDDDAT